MAELLRVTPVAAMGDETFNKHLELRHGNDLSVNPAWEGEDLRHSSLWRTYHQTQHRLQPSSYDHEHNDAE